MEYKNLGSLAADREQQVIEWAMKNPYVSFTVKGFVYEVFENRIPLTSKYYKLLAEAYSVACRDLQRKQILKGLDRGNDKEVFILNDIEVVKSILNPEKER